MSLPQFPVKTAFAPEDLIFAMYGEKSFTFPIG